MSDKLLENSFMKTLAAVFTIGLLLPVTANFSVKASEAISGWQKLKFGMPRDAVKSTYAGEENDLLCQDPDVREAQGPFDCNYIAIKNGPSGFIVSAYFLSGFGLAKIHLLSDSRSYDDVKSALTQRYGAGSETEVNDEHKCAVSNSKWENNGRAAPADFIFQRGKYYVISGPEGKIVLKYVSEVICDAAPEQFSNRLTYMLKKTYSINYRTISVDYLANTIDPKNL
jgi:hypothetical protein